MNAEELRRRAVKRRKELKRPDNGDIADRTWRWLEKREYVEDALGKDFDEEAVQFIVDQIDELYAAVPYGGTRHSAREDGEPKEFTLRVGEYVSTRARAISESLAGFADESPDVTHFRQKVLGGHLLSPEEARAVLGGSVLDEIHELELRKLGSLLVDDYIGWDEDGAIWYVLTGEAPQLRPVRIRGHGKLERLGRPFQHEVTLSVLPWVPAKEVERAYRNVQKQLLDETPHETGVRILEVAQFCWRQYRETGAMPSWRAYFERWNQAHPSKRFNNWRNFREYFLRGSKAAIPIYKLPEPKPSAEEQQEIQAAQEYWIKKVQGYRDKHSDRFVEATFEEA